MSPTFRSMSLEEFAQLLARFTFTRRVNAVHMHHTWRPNHAQWRGHESVVAMWRHHTEVNGWSDIAQHITIDPAGMIWAGRNWNRAPASASGHNGNGTAGPFMFELVGDFDRGRDRFEGAQKHTALHVIALVQKRFGLAPESLRFHREMSTKTCPGSAVAYAEVLEEVRALHAAGVPVGAPVLAGGLDALPFPADALAVEVLARELAADAAGPTDPADAEPAEEEGWDVARVVREAPFERVERAGLTPEDLSGLRPHVINLGQGEFSDDGRFSTSAGDVDAIFEQHLPRELAAAQAQGQPLRLLFYAHGGLVPEAAALQMAHERVGWWLRQGIYPIYFVWETGLLETLGQLLERTRTRARAAVRDVFDFTTDPLVEVAVRTLGGPKVWSGMKRSAELAAEPGRGGAHYAAEKLAAFVAGHGAAVELHALGHSAGAIFHAHFLPAALAALRTTMPAGAPAFRTVHFLAPALRVELFQRQLAPLLGNGIENLTLFTMKKDAERADHCKQVYRKSLLYLIHHALEPAGRTPILGLEESLREDDTLRRTFALGDRPSPVAEVVWSPSPVDTGRSASRSTSHGGFDNDDPTMNSVVRRVLGLADAQPLRVAPPRTRALADPWETEIEWPEALSMPPETVPAGPVFAAVPLAVPQPAAPQPPLDESDARARGRRRALCVGIDDYPSAPLAGCVADARLWAKTLRRLQFEQPELLVNEQATRSAILDRLSALVRASRAGDVIVFQYSGHGTQLRDLNGDERKGDTPGLDEALCPFDMDTGAYVIDDDLGRIFNRVPEGVNLTCFIDCCHSGTISRLGVGAAADRPAGDQRARFVPATPQMEEAHIRFRSRVAEADDGTRGPDRMREVLFSACQSSEVAWESNGQGEFTLRAVRLLRDGTAGLTNEQFLRQVRSAFGKRPRQHPQLDCPDDARARGLLQPLPAREIEGVPVATPLSQETLLQILRLLSDAAGVQV